MRHTRGITGAYQGHPLRTPVQASSGEILSCKLQRSSLERSSLALLIKYARQTSESAVGETSSPFLHCFFCSLTFEGCELSKFFNIKMIFQNFSVPQRLQLLSTVDAKFWISRFIFWFYFSDSQFDSQFDFRFMVANSLIWIMLDEFDSSEKSNFPIHGKHNSQGVRIGVQVWNFKSRDCQLERWKPIQGLSSKKQIRALFFNVKTKNRSGFHVNFQS